LGYLVTGKPKAHEDVINALNNATKDPDERVRAAATEALQRIRKGGGAD
jgi:HEAT repeat protein